MLLISTLISSLYAQEIDSIIDIRDGQVYKIVKIGEQWWMQENLNIGRFVESISTGSDHSDVSDNGIIEKYCYGNNVDNCTIYGGLYDWNEMMDYNPSDDGNPGTTQGICPVGWHLPTDHEWTELTDYLGGEDVAGGKLKEVGTVYWASPNTGASNESGFTALPGGYRGISGNFTSMSFYAYFWSSTESNSSYAWYRLLSFNSSGVYRDYTNKDYGFSVRCLRDFWLFGYLTIWDENFNSVSTLNFYENNISEEIVLINSSAGKTINISSIYNKNSVYSLDKFSVALSPGDSIHLIITFNPPARGIYLDTIKIESDDPYNPLIAIPLKGIVNPTEICGVITQNSTWTMENSPYLVSCNLAVAKDVTLTIEPGVTVVVDSMKKITVDGTLTANGTEGEIIMFTNDGDDRFDQIHVRSTGTFNLSYFIIEEAKTAVYAENDSILITDGIINNCTNGIEITSSAYLKAENLIIQNNKNEGTGITSGSDSKGIINGCVIEGHSSGIIVNEGSFDITGNTVKNNMNTGISYNNSSDTNCLRENTIVYNGMGLSASNGIISNNVISFNSVDGAYINGADFSFNKVHNNGGYGVRGYSSKISYNQINNNTGNGIIANSCEIQGNQVYANGLNGIFSELGNTIENNIISYNSEDGIHDNLNSTIMYNSIFSNQDDGIQTTGLPTINNNNIYGNGGYNIHATRQSSEVINAENNYWGVTGLAEIRTTIYDYYDDGVTVEVDIEPYLTEEVSSSLLDFAENTISCYGEPVPDLISSGEDIKWYSDEEHNNLVHTGDTFSTGNTEIGVYTYYVTQTINDSIVLNDTATLVISSIPAILSIEKTSETTCNSNDGTITITATDENPLLYSVDGGNNYFDNDGIFTDLSNGNYPVVVINSNGCKTSGGTVEIISEGVIPPAPVAGKDTSYCPGDTIKDLYAIASTGGTLTWYSDPGLNNVVGTGTSYSPSGLIESTSFYVTETKNNCESPSTTVTIKIRNDPPFEDEELCLITIDLATGKNLLVWEKTPNEGIASYNIYRETSVIGQYEKIGNIPYNQLSVFKDLTATPEERQYLYKITVVDSCGNESEKSPYHKPLFLQYVGSTGGVNLQWSDYEIEGGDISFITYEIYRGEDPSTLQKITDVSASLDRFTDTYSEALNKKFYYRIAGVRSEPCYPTGNLKGINLDYSRSMSNLEDNKVVSVPDIKSHDKLVVYPNPFNVSTTVKFNNQERHNYTLYIKDITGKVIRTINNITDEKIKLNRGGLPAGLYLIELRGPEIYRGKIVVE